MKLKSQLKVMLTMPSHGIKPIQCGLAKLVDNETNPNGNFCLTRVSRVIKTQARFTNRENPLQSHYSNAEMLFEPFLIFKVKSLLNLCLHFLLLGITLPKRDKIKTLVVTPCM